jgi:hypothetical protein
MGSQVILVFVLRAGEEILFNIVDRWSTCPDTVSDDSLDRLDL